MSKANASTFLKRQFGRGLGASLLLSLLSPATALAQQGPLPVDVAAPLQAKIIDWNEYTGRFEAVERVELRARVSGYLDAIKFRDGQLVKKGEVLFVVDPRPFQAAHSRAEAELQAAQAEQTRAAADLVRGEELVSNRTLSESVLDERRAVKLQSDAQVAIAEAALRTAALDLEFTEVKAPFSGRISATEVDVGNLVTTGETELAVLVSINPIHLVFTASEADFLRYSRLNAEGSRPSSRNAANRVEARLIDEQGWPHHGKMDFVDNEIDPNAGTITGRAIFTNDDDLLTPGLFARLRLVGSGEYEAQLLPDTAILSDQARKIVLTLAPLAAEDPRKPQCGEAPCQEVVAKVVTLGAIHRGLRVIKSGLSPEDRVIVSGVQRARPGGLVIPQPTELDFAGPDAATNGD
ncbi:MAG: efflux RND transporter periplasmic adaptor subunit [Rhodobacteraceae bacterium]|nr:efflux RND transporter periplasmic adaptor subunit [Paracoccaceae bacterium]